MDYAMTRVFRRALSVLANGSKGCRGDDTSSDNDTFSRGKPISEGGATPMWVTNLVTTCRIFLNVCGQKPICESDSFLPADIGNGSPRPKL